MTFNQNEDSVILALPNPGNPNGSTLLSVVVPCYNEAEVIELFHGTIRRELDGIVGLEFEIIMVDDGSTDETLSLLNGFAARDPRIRVCSLSRNFGHQVALSAGMDFAVGHAVVMMDADLQHPPAVIPEMIEAWRDGHDVVSAVRSGTADASWFKKTTSNCFYRLLRFLSRTEVAPGAADFCLLSRRACESLRRMPERHRFLRGMISWIGFERAYVPFTAPARAAGRSKYTSLRMLALALDAIFSFSAEPLRLALRAGILITISGFAYLAWTLLNGFILGQLVPGYASLIGVTMILGGCQLSFLGLIGQYLARVFEEVKQRPMYFVKQEPRSPAVPARVAEWRDVETAVRVGATAAQVRVRRPS